MTALLEYTIATSPFPVTASATSGSQVIAQITLVATNATSSDVSLAGLIVQFSVGPGATDLTSNATAVGPVPPSGWVLATTQYPPGFVNFVFQPSADPATIPANESTLFVFNNVQINSTPGAAVAVVTEGSNNCSPPKCPTTSLTITKWPEGWGQVSFWADPNIIAQDGDTTLNWSGPVGATYQIQYYTPQTGPVTIPAVGQPALSNQGQYPGALAPPLTLVSTTTFYLTVVQNISEVIYESQQQVTVTVELPPPVIDSFTYALLSNELGPILALNWQTTNAEYCTLTGDSNLLQPNSQDNTYEIFPDSLDSLLTSYTLTATNQSGQATSTLIQSLIKLPVSGWSAGATTSIAVTANGETAFCIAYGGVALLSLSAGTATMLKKNGAGGDQPLAIAVTPDGSRYYTISGSSMTVEAFDGQTMQSVAGPASLPSNPAAADSVIVAGTPPMLFASAEDGNGNGWVTVYDGIALSQITTVNVGSGPRSMAASPDGTRVYVSCELGSVISVIDATHQPPSLIGTTGVGAAPLGIAVTPDSKMVLVACHFDNTVWVLDSSTNPMTRIGQPVGVGTMPWGIAASQNLAFVANSNDGTISQINLTMNPIATVGPSVGTGVYCMSVRLSLPYMIVLVAELDGSLVALTIGYAPA